MLIYKIETYSSNRILKSILSKKELNILFIKFIIEIICLS